MWAHRLILYRVKMFRPMWYKLLRIIFTAAAAFVACRRRKNETKRKKNQFVIVSKDYYLLTKNKMIKMIAISSEAYAVWCLKVTHCCRAHRQTQTKNYRSQGKCSDVAAPYTTVYCICIESDRKLFQRTATLLFIALVCFLCDKSSVRTILPICANDKLMNWIQL